jgi:FkbM family methyltransferase
VGLTMQTIRARIFYRLGQAEKIRHAFKYLRSPACLLGAWNNEKKVGLKNGQILLVSRKNLASLFQYLKALDIGHGITIESPDMKKISFDYNGKKVTLTGSDAIGLASQTFFTKYSQDLSVEGNVVVDVGASIGDTAIFFALNKAKKVIAYEPYPVYNDMVRNIGLNRLENKIQAMHEGIDGKDGCVLIGADMQTKSSQKLVDRHEGEKIKVSSIGRMIREHGLDRQAVMKMDCEGCEYGAILEASDEELRTFCEILMEYHGPLAPLQSKLEKAGFKIDVMPNGAILAKRKEIAV